MQAGKTHQGSLIERNCSNCKPFYHLGQIKLAGNNFAQLRAIVRATAICQKRWPRRLKGHSKLDH